MSVCMIEITLGAEVTEKYNLYMTRGSQAFFYFGLSIPMHS